MTQQKLIASIEQYQPYNVQEEMDKSLILEWIKNNNNAFLRENTIPGPGWAAMQMVRQICYPWQFAK